MAYSPTEATKKERNGEKADFEKELADLKKKNAELEAELKNERAIPKKNLATSVQQKIESDMQAYLKSILDKVNIVVALQGCLYVPGTSGLIIYGKYAKGDTPEGLAKKHFNVLQELGIISPGVQPKDRIRVCYTGKLAGAYYTIDEESKIEALQQKDYAIEVVRTDYPEFYNDFMKHGAEIEKLIQLLNKLARDLRSTDISPKEKLSRLDFYLSSHAASFTPANQPSPKPYNTSSGLITPVVSSSQSTVATLSSQPPTPF